MSIKKIFLALLFYSNFAYSEIPTIQDYQSKNDPNAYELYIYGLESGLEWANEHTFQKYSIEIFCKPRDLSLSLRQLNKIISQEIQDNNRFYKKYKNAPLVGLALRNGYIANYPCNK